MYSVVLLMAVTAGSESADFGRRGCGCSCRCFCTCSCSCFRGCHCGCFRGCFSCGCSSYYCGGCSCYSYCSGCTTCYSCYSYCGGCTIGCVGCVTPVTHGTIIGYNQPVAAISTNVATVVVTLPADARLKINGHVMTNTSSERTFVSPALEPGKTYSYTIEAEYQVDGKPVTVSKKVIVEANKTSRVDLNPAQATTVASRN